MKKFLGPILFFTFLFSVYKADGQIVADHTVVDLYDDIPRQYIDSAKEMLVFMAGESHSGAYRAGQDLLELLDTSYQVVTFDSDPPPAPTDQNLRIGRPFMIGESSFFSQSGIDNLKTHITSQNDSGNPYDVMGFAWCWDMTWQNPPGGELDTVHLVHWAGSSEDGPDGNRRWGLDAGDSVLTGNRVCMDTYLQAIEEYSTFSEDSSYITRWIFTTGPVDGIGNDGTEQGFQRELKHDYIRNYAYGDTSRILFDYADILCWSDSGDVNISNWIDGDSIRPHLQIHPDNLMDYDDSWNKIPFDDDDEDHIGEVGAVRIAKAMWWMLARMSGWDGTIAVKDIQVMSRDSISEIMTGDTLRLTAEVIPGVATKPSVVWSLVEGDGSGTISEDGLLRGWNPGSLTVVAAAMDGSGVADSLLINISPPTVAVSGIEITSENGIDEIVMGDTLQFSAEVFPDTATNPEVSWSIITSTVTASISNEGLLIAGTSGMLTVVATALDGSGVSDSMQINITSYEILVTGIELSTEGGLNELESGDTLQILAKVLPVNSTNKDVYWIVEPPASGTSGTGSIDQNGLFIADLAGQVLIVASSLDGSGVSDNFDLTIREQVGLKSQEEVDLLVWPNPGGGYFFIDVSAFRVNYVKVISAEGRIVLELAPPHWNEILQLDLHEQPKGLYMVLLGTQQGSFSRQLILAH